MTDDGVVPAAVPVHPGDPAPYLATTASTSIPGRTLGIVGFVLSFFFLLDIGGLVVSISALVLSRRAGHRNGFAVAGIIISVVGIILSAVVVGVSVSALVDAANVCGRLGNGVHVIGNSTYRCTPTSFNVTSHG
jgi:hypothetical protein